MPACYDSYNRPINYLRISVTDRCNLNCVYCTPPGMVRFSRTDVLSYEEIARVAAAAAVLGVSKVRLTGGEPLVRGWLSRLIKMLAAIPGIDDISVTTNGILLEKRAAELKAAGLKRVNVSLDSLDPARFERITRGGHLDVALKGIEAARAAGLNPVKINVVVMGGVNDDEIVDFARLTTTSGWNVRFIELMPFVAETGLKGRFISMSEVQERLKLIGELQPCSGVTGNGPARYFRLSGATGTLGFISPVSDHFCFSCNRLRLTADGKLRTCLLNNDETDLRQPLRSGVSGEQLGQIIQEAIRRKPKQHHLNGALVLQRPMTKLGG